jgi:hypothetical protein
VLKTQAIGLLELRKTEFAEILSASETAIDFAILPKIEIVELCGPILRHGRYFPFGH